MIITRIWLSSRNSRRVNNRFERPLVADLGLSQDVGKYGSDTFLLIFVFGSMNGPSARPQAELFQKYLAAIWEAFGKLEAEEASSTHLEVRSQKSQLLSAEMQKLY